MLYPSLLVSLLAIVYDLPVMPWSDLSRFGLVALILSCATRTQAAPVTAGQSLDAPTLSWEAPSACPSRDAVVRQIETFLGQPFTMPRPQRIALRASVQELEDGSFVLRLVALTAQGESDRVLRHGDCATLAKAAALVMAVAIDPGLARQQREGQEGASAGPLHRDSTATAGSPTADLAPTPASEWMALLQQPLMCPRPKAKTGNVSPPVVGEESASPEAAGPIGWSFWAETAIASGVLPDLGPTIGGGLGFGDLDRWRLQLYGRYWVRQQVSVPGYPEASVTLRMLSGGIRACAVPFVSDCRVLACVGPEVGDLRVAGRRDMQTRPPNHRRWSALLGSVGAEFPLGSRFLLTTSVEGGWVPWSIDVGVEEVGQGWLGVAETRPFVADLSVRLGMRLQ